MNSKYSYKIFQILLNSPKLDYKIKVYSGRDKNYLNSGESNKSQSKNALGFGERFSRLSIRRKNVESRLISAIEDEAAKSIDTNKKHLNTTRNDTPFAIMRKAQIRDCEQILNVIEVLRNKK